jgi:hypothetical protein
VIRGEPARDAREQLLAIAVLLDHELLQIPPLARRQRHAIGLEDDLDLTGGDVELPVEPAARAECERGIAEHGDAVHGPRPGWLRQTIVLRVGVVAQVDRGADRAAGLGEHLEAFAVERRPGVGAVPQRGKDDVADGHGPPAGVRDLRSADRTVPPSRQGDFGSNAAVGRHHPPRGMHRQVA